MICSTPAVENELAIAGISPAPSIGHGAFQPILVGGTISMLTHPLDHLPPTKTSTKLSRGFAGGARSAVTIQRKRPGAVLNP